MLYLSEKTDNWNEGLNPELTSDMHLIYPFHNLYEHACFSIFDLYGCAILMWKSPWNTIMQHIKTNSCFLT